MGRSDDVEEQANKSGQSKTGLQSCVEFCTVTDGKAAPLLDVLEEF